MDASIFPLFEGAGVEDLAAVEIPAACGCGRGVIDNGGDAVYSSPLQSPHLVISGEAAERSRA